jgi:ATP-binding cassette, subfamily F, member 3
VRRLYERSAPPRSLPEMFLYRFPETEKISPPLLQLNGVTFGYTPDKILLKGINIDVGLDSRCVSVRRYRIVFYSPVFS